MSEFHEDGSFRPLDDAESRKAVAVGWLMSVIEHVEKDGAQGFALVHIQEDGNIGSTWVDLSSGGVWAKLAAGVGHLHNRLTK